MEVFFSRNYTSYFVKEKILKICRIMVNEKNDEEKEMRTIYHLIRKMGVTSKYKGYYFVAEAVKLSMEDAGHPLRITKDVYPPLARKYKSTPNNIEHNIRTVVNVCWSANKDQMDRIAGYPLICKPTNSEFVDMLAFYLSSDER